MKKIKNPSHSPSTHVAGNARKASRTLRRNFKAFPDDTATAQRIRELLNGLHNNKEDSEIDERVYRAIRVAAKITGERKVPQNDLMFANPLLIAEALITYGTDLQTVLAAILYPALRPVKAKETKPEIKFDRKYIGRIAADPLLGAEVASVVLNTLEIREVNFLARPAISLITERRATLSEQSRLAGGRTMVREIVRHEGALSIRMLQKKLEGDNLLQLLLKGERGLKEREDVLLVRPIEQIYIPIAEAASTVTPELSVSLEEITDFRGIMNALEDLRLQLRFPQKYNEARQVIDQQIKLILLHKGKDNLIENAGARRKVALEIVRDFIREQIQEDIRDNCIIQGRIKTAPSLQRLWDRKGRDADISDIFAFRVIYRKPHLRDFGDEIIDPIRVRHTEFPVVREIHKYVCSKIEAVPGRLKDRIDDPTDGGKREDNNYRAIHNSFRFGEGCSEVIFVGAAMHHINMTDPYAAHRHYKGATDAPGISVDTSISVYGPDNDIYNLPRGASTVADLLASINFSVTNIAFSVPAESIHIERSELFGPVSIDSHNPFKTLLHTNDRVTFSLDPQLVNDAGHRWNVVMACHDPEFRKILYEQHCALDASTPTAAAKDIPGRKPRDFKV